MADHRDVYRSKFSAAKIRHPLIDDADMFSVPLGNRYYIDIMLDLNSILRTLTVISLKPFTCKGLQFPHLEILGDFPEHIT